MENEAIPKEGPRASQELYPGYSDRREFFENYVKPHIDPLKPMYYPASGAALAEFVGSGTDEAYYVDPIYNWTYPQEPKSQVGSGLASLIKRVKTLDPNSHLSISVSQDLKPYRVTFRQTEGGEEIETIFPENDLTRKAKPMGEWKTRTVSLPDLKGAIVFKINDQQKTINFEGRDAIGYIPNGIKKGYSVFVSIGHDVIDLFEPPAQADLYVVSLIAPRALGFGEVSTSSSETAFGVSVCHRYENPNLTPEEKNILIGLNSSPALIGSLVSAMLQGSEELERKRVFLSKIENAGMVTEEPFAEIAGRHFTQRFSSLTKLRPSLRQLFIKGMSRYVEDRYAKLIEKPEGKVLMGKILGALKGYSGGS